MRAAKLAAAAEALKRKSGVSAPFSLVFMTDRKRAPNPLLVARALPKGSAVVLRDYGMPKRAALAAQLAQICAARDLFLIIGADPLLAGRVGAKGLHAPSWFRIRNDLSRDLIITASCHNDAELRAAKVGGAHIAFLSPVFSTESHPEAPELGARCFRHIAAASPLPVLALGGVNEENAARIAGSNVAGLAAIGAFVR